MMVAQGGFDKKEEVENPSEVLLNPSDPEATFRYKAGGRHLGYVGNVVEAGKEKSSLVIDYDYQQNIYADNQFMKDYLNEKKDFSDGSFIVADGANISSNVRIIVYLKTAFMIRAMIVPLRILG